MAGCVGGRREEKEEERHWSKEVNDGWLSTWEDGGKEGGREKERH